MRDLRILEAFRNRAWEARLGGRGDAGHGAFEVAGPAGVALRVIASTSGGWDHVSVSLPARTPTWEEMEFIKRLFFRENETAMQLHVPPAEHINHHPHCLHLWRPQTLAIPRPPKEMIA